MSRYLQGEHHPQQALSPRVAYVAGHLTRRHDCDGEVQYLFVAPEHRGRGIASELLRVLADWFVAQDASRICVNVAPDHVPARALYAHLGAVELSKCWLVWSDIKSIRATLDP